MSGMIYKTKEELYGAAHRAVDDLPKYSRNEVLAAVKEYLDEGGIPIEGRCGVWLVDTKNMYVVSERVEDALEHWGKR